MIGDDKHGRVVALVADQDREGVHVGARRRRAAGELGRVERRHERAVVDVGQHVDGDQ